MAITVFASPRKLSWLHFTPVPNRIRDPHDGSLQDALTQFDFFLPDRPPRQIDGQYALADPLTLLITPNARVWTGVRQTDELLSHEQFHYDVGIVIARAAARHFMSLRARTVEELRQSFQQAARLHFVTRNRLIQRRYDLDTQHGQNAHYQRIWKRRMAACLANPRSDTLGGFVL